MAEGQGPYLWAMGVWGRAVLRAPRSFVVADNEISATNSLAAIGYGNAITRSPDYQLPIAICRLPDRAIPRFSRLPFTD